MIPLKTSPFAPLSFDDRITRGHPSITSAPGLMKRMFDFACALAGGLLISPLLLLLAVAIKLDSAGPVLFKQRRVGLNGQEFWMYKFRSMSTDAEGRLATLMAQNEMQGPLFKMRNDPRVTRVGRFIRRTSLDELPQIFNVIRGDMSLVGPRPPLPSEVAQFEPWHMEKFVVRPGMTGLWQVSGRNELCGFKQMIELDIEYVRRWNVGFDFSILARTLSVVLKGVGAH